jgi:hypothetical protein
MTAKEFVKSIYPDAQFKKIPFSERFLYIEFDPANSGDWDLIKVSKREYVQWNDAKKILNRELMRKLGGAL